jgi:hypothetical protein
LSQNSHHLFIGFFSAVIAITLQQSVQLPQVRMGRFPRRVERGANDERDLDPVKIGDGEADIAASPTPSCDRLEMQTGATGYFVPRCAPARFRPIEAV